MALRWRARYAFTLTIVLLLFIFLCAALSSRIFYRVMPGQAAVLQRFFTGTDTERVYEEGLLIVFPWNTPYLYDIREQQITQSVDVLSFNGLSIEVVFSFRFYPVVDALGKLHQRLGPDYVDKVVNPLLIAGVREVIGHYRPEELYTTHSATIQDEIRQVCERDIEQNHIAFSQILVKDINLPAKVSGAIEDKLVLQQEAEGYDFRLMSEERERLRKKIEAEGIREFNAIVAEVPDDALLRHKNIAALQALALSENAKVVVLGGKGNDSVNLPIFMDDGDRFRRSREEQGRASIARPSGSRPREEGVADPASAAQEGAAPPAGETDSAPLLERSSAPAESTSKQRNGQATPASDNPPPASDTKMRTTQAGTERQTSRNEPGQKPAKGGASSTPKSEGTRTSTGFREPSPGGPARVSPAAPEQTETRHAENAPSKGPRNAPGAGRSQQAASKSESDRREQP